MECLYRHTLYIKEKRELSIFLTVILTMSNTLL